MTAPDPIQAFATAMSANNVLMGTALTNVAAFAVAQAALIATLQNSPGTISPADQTTLDGLETNSNAMLAQINAIAGAVPGTIPTVVPIPTPAP